MKINTTIGFDGDPQPLVQQAPDFQSAGVDLVWNTEIYGYDLISTLVYLSESAAGVQLDQATQLKATLAGARYIHGHATEAQLVRLAYYHLDLVECDELRARTWCANLRQHR